MGPTGVHWFWGLGCPVGPNKHYKMWGASPPILEWCLGPPGLHKPHISFRPAQKPRVKHRCPKSIRGPLQNFSETLRLGHGVFNTRVWGRPEFVGFGGGLGDSGTPKTSPECEDLRPPHFRKAFGATGAAQATKTDYSSRPKNHLLKTVVLGVSEALSETQ